ncbi:hypothetical protein FNV43_RR25896 [Rhamnella rubrinervis]|uniref:Uncharacterized protein n=1 Tax=Rhamnella rubrinervis TaxID=2594499 RepID=A0A8K0DIP5_9ROSA|nr:hypothetical protein FNV43_RR25896 [Rhamnella rubrinervis]
MRLLKNFSDKMMPSAKSRNETGEQGNYEIVIEVSHLEAAINALRGEVLQKTSAIENLEKLIAEKDGRISETEREMLEKLAKAESEVMELRQFVSECDERLTNTESKMEAQRPLLADQLNLVSKIHDRICNVMKVVDANNFDQSEFAESLFLPQETDMEENIRASLAGMESIYGLTRIVIEKTKDLVEEKNRQIKSSDETLYRLVKEKYHIGSLLRSTLSKWMTSNQSTKSELFQVAENGLREAGIDFKFSKHIGDMRVPSSNDKAGALENIVKASQLEIIELQHSVDELRAESNLLKDRIETQGKELDHRMNQIEELAGKERVANENKCLVLCSVDESAQRDSHVSLCTSFEIVYRLPYKFHIEVKGLMLDIAAAEEEISRWKVAAEDEVVAGRAVEQEFLAQLSALKKELEEAKGAMLESEKKLKFKEETAAAAMAARDAAEKSLKLADMRASRLRDRVEEPTRQLEEFENREDLRRGRIGPRYACRPWQWLGLDFVGSNRSDMQQQNSNEMELSEPLL